MIAHFLFSSETLIAFRASVFDLQMFRFLVLLQIFIRSKFLQTIFALKIFETQLFALNMMNEISSLFEIALEAIGANVSNQRFTLYLSASLHEFTARFIINLYWRSIKR